MNLNRKDLPSRGRSLANNKMDSIASNNYKRIKEKGKPVYLKNGRVVGYVLNKTFWKFVKKSRHLLRKPEGWASDIYALKMAWRLGARQIRIVDKESNTHYLSTINDFREYGIVIERGFGLQLVLILPYWKTRQFKTSG